MTLKRYLMLTIGLCLGLTASMAQNYTFTAEHTPEFKSTSQPQKVSMQYNMHSLSFVNTTVRGESMQRIQLNNHLGIPGAEGSPDLPVINKNIAVPQGAQPHLNYIVKDSVVLEHINIAPNARIPLDTEADFPLKKGSVYKEDSWYPKNISNIELTEIRGLQVARLQFCPFKYNPQKQQLIVYTDIDFNLSWEQDKGNYVEPRFRSRHWDAILQDYLINYQDLEQMDYNQRSISSKTDGCEYLILIPDVDVYHQWADSLMRFRNEQGIHTRIMTIPEIGGNTVANLNNFFSDVYHNWNPVPAAVLLMADYAEDESGFIARRWNHPNEGTYVSDNYYADVTGNKLPDFVFARMTANNEEELSTMVGKCIGYESHPPQESHFYHQPITALGWQTVRWFQICSEVVGGYWRNQLGKEPIRINAVYDGNPTSDPWSTADNTYTILQKFGPNGLDYIPATPGELGGWTGGTADDVVNAINKGACMLMHRDHGFYGGWGEPGFSSGNISKLNNSNKLLHVFSVNCLTGRFDTGDGCFAEKMLRHPNGGALSITAASQVSYSFVNDVLVWGMMDNMMPDFMPEYGAGTIAERDFLPAFGLAAGKYFLSNSNWASAYYKQLTYRLFHHHGDAFNTVYYEQPKTNHILHDKYLLSNTNSITVEAEHGSLVGLSKGGELLCAAIVPESGSVELQFPNQNAGNQLKIVISKQNYLRYESHINIVEPQAQFLSLNKLKFNDANGNDSIENGETVNISLWLKNIGTAAYSSPIHIRLSSTSNDIDITQNQYTLNELDANTSILLDNIFSFTCSYNIADLSSIPIEISIDGNNFSFETTAYAPQLKWSPIRFEETAGGNGNHYIDPSETVNARFVISNTGHASLPSGILSLSNGNSNITLTHNNQNFETMRVGDSIVAECSISCDASVPTHSIAQIIAKIEAIPIIKEKNIYFSIGQTLEDWETANFTHFEWQRAGDAEWEISDRYKFDGEYAASSPELDHNQQASLILSYDCMGEGIISFYVMVSSEFNHDFLSFYIDDVLQEQWSKLVLFDNGYREFHVSEGKHTFRWTYAKDAAGQSGLDKCWLDHIVLPAGECYDKIEEHEIANNTERFVVYPNPAQDFIYVDSKNNSNAMIHIDLWDAMGRKIKSISHQGSQLKIATQRLSNGIYFISLSDDNSQIIEKHKIMINK